MNNQAEKQVLEIDKARQLPAVGITPPQMLALAVERGADISQLEKLMDLQERWEAGEAKKAFVSAMSEFKANPPKINKNRSVAFGTTKYKHASLGHVCDQIGGGLGAVGISYRWLTNQDDKGVIRVTCILTHQLGHSEETALRSSPDQSGGKNSIQAIGSTVTYLQRYTLLAATGMATDEQDDDGVSSEQSVEASASHYPDGDFKKNFPKWADAIKGGHKTAAEIADMVVSKGALTNQQKAQVDAVKKIGETA
jgi:hypothetical protein